MKKFGILLAFTFGFAGPALADPVEGVWKTKPGDDGKYGHVQIKPCGSKICGVLIKGFDSTGKSGPSENIGKNIVWDMVAQGGGSYSGGKVWAPDRNKTYNAKMQLNGNTLSVSGCALGGLICRASKWSRVK